MTAQLHENLILDDGTKKSMDFCPPLPEHHPRIIERTPAEREIEDSDTLAFSTACWRRYIGTWKIMDGSLFLVEIRGKYKIVGDEPILADWFTGVLRFPEGKLLHYVHMGFGSVYEDEVHVKFEKGGITGLSVIDNRGNVVNEEELVMRNLPGSENNFEGDDEM
jgi:hypothetical protein